MVQLEDENGKDVDKMEPLELGKPLNKGGINCRSPRLGRNGVYPERVEDAEVFDHADVQGRDTADEACQQLSVVEAEGVCAVEDFGRFLVHQLRDLHDVGFQGQAHLERVLSAPETLPWTQKITLPQVIFERALGPAIQVVRKVFLAGDDLALEPRHRNATGAHDSNVA
ncbi:hypothetical protein MPH_04011 [Macrophomina phaseolina MS6]|uniref:Uncharacterized protein n=1 Tax=Macrophomina phaseolina (strain MS6) TaxID=1126212 RepID=K2S183_MACPH|nr:hypothetical protein MPH_04011 [Macrophomina phaseolina MS6]